LQPFESWFGPSKSRRRVCGHYEEIDVAGTDVVPVELRRVSQGFRQSAFESLNVIAALKQCLAKPKHELILHSAAGEVSPWAWHIC